MIALIATLMLAQAPQISRVVVYPDRAQVTRSAAVTCAARAEVEFAELPPGADPGSLRATALGAVVEGLEVQERPREKSYAPQAEALDKLIDQLNVKAKGERDRQARAQSRQGAAQAYLKLASGRVSREMALAAPDTKAWTAAYDSALAARLKAAQEQVAPSADLRETERLLAGALQKRARLGEARQKRERFARVLLSCAKSGEATIALTYMVSGAGWTPAYEARSEEEGLEQGVDLTLIATVSQSTGEDWKQVRLALSTAVPRQDATPPELTQLRIFAQQREAPKKVLVRREEEQRHAESGSRGNGAGAADVDIEAQGLSVQLAPRELADVPGDGAPARLRVATTLLRGAFAYRTVPAQLPSVFRVADLVNDAPFPLLAGPIDLFRKGGLVARHALPRIAQGEKFHLTLGLAEGLKVKRTVLREIAQDTGVFSKGKRYNYGYRFELRSFLPGTTVVELSDRVPVSELDDVEVGIDDAATTTGYVQIKDEGRIDWKVPLEQGAPKTVDLAFHVDLPASYDTAGL